MGHSYETSELNISRAQYFNELKGTYDTVKEDILAEAFNRATQKFRHDQTQFASALNLFGLDFNEYEGKEKDKDKDLPDVRQDSAALHEAFAGRASKRLQKASEKSKAQARQALDLYVCRALIDIIEEKYRSHQGSFYRANQIFRGSGARFGFFRLSSTFMEEQMRLQAALTALRARSEQNGYGASRATANDVIKLTR